MCACVLNSRETGWDLNHVSDHFLPCAVVGITCVCTRMHAHVHLNWACVRLQIYSQVAYSSEDRALVLLCMCVCARRSNGTSVVAIVALPITLETIWTWERERDKNYTHHLFILFSRTTTTTTCSHHYPRRSSSFSRQLGVANYKLTYCCQHSWSWNKF